MDIKRITEILFETSTNIVETGWLSDMEAYELTADPELGDIYVGATGSIDISHLAAIVHGILKGRIK